YGNIVSLAESPLVEGLLYVGTDDGLIQVSEDGGTNWRKENSFPGVPKLAYVPYITPSLHDADTVYASFHNHKQGDFKPYIFKSTDRGRSWDSIANDLPERNFVWAIQQDHISQNLLFAGTEFGLYFTIDEGKNWHRLRSGLPTIAVRDLDIARDHDDLVLGTFGRSFYVLDDYSSLRALTTEGSGDNPVIYPIQDALIYSRGSRLGGRSGKGSQGAAFYAASNPDFGATFTYYLPEKYETRKELRKKREREQGKDGGDIPYPSWEDLRTEDNEKDPQVFLIIRDDSGRVVQRITGSRNSGQHRATWDLREASPNPAGANRRSGGGPWALPGPYSVQIATLIDGKYTEIGDAQNFRVVPLGNATLSASDAEAAFAHQAKASRLARAVRATSGVLEDMRGKIGALRTAAIRTPGMDPAWIARIESIEARLTDLNTVMNGDGTVSRRQEATLPGINARISHATSNWNTTGAPTETEKQAYEIAGRAFAKTLAELRDIVEKDIPEIESALEAVGAGGISGRLPDWKIER
ncbi:MAG: glycosyl hydrolase, partial [Planctomycetes bacterium]|nr:glycosyl hydrolase [Planctomycetota bacterium]